MELKPNIGIGNIKFGMTKNAIIQTLGMPDKIKIEEDDSDSQYLEYNSHNLRLTIYKNEEDRLGYIYSSHKDLTYNGLLIIDQDIDVVKREVFRDLVKTWEIEDYDFFSVHGDDLNWLTLNEEFGKVKSVEIGVPWKNEEEYDWPNHLQLT